MKLLIPGTGNCAAEGVPGPLIEGRGRVTRARAEATLNRRSSTSPTPAPISATAAVPAAASRNRRRPGWAAAFSGAGVPTATTSAVERAEARADEPPGPVGARTSSASASAPAATPTRVGTTSTGRATGRERTAATPMAPNTASPRRPNTRLRIAMIPGTAANTASTTTMPLSRTSLSSRPKCWIAKSLTGTGVRSMAALPTAITGTPPGPVMPATSWAAPRAIAAASSPAAAPVSGPVTVLVVLRSVRPALLCVITVLLRSVADRGLVGRGADLNGVVGGGYRYLMYQHRHFSCQGSYWPRSGPIRNLEGSE